MMFTYSLMIVMSLLLYSVFVGGTYFLRLDFIVTNFFFIAECSIKVTAGTEICGQPLIAAAQGANILNCMPCELCTENTYCDTTTPNCVSCKQCAADHYLDVSSASCVPCSEGSHSTVGATSCITCALGDFWNASVGDCVLCKPGNYCTGGKTYACPMNKVSPAGAQSESQCCTTLFLGIRIDVHTLDSAWAGTWDARNSICNSNLDECCCFKDEFVVTSLSAGMVRISGEVHGNTYDGHNWVSCDGQHFEDEFLPSGREFSGNYMENERITRLIDDDTALMDDNLDYPSCSGGRIPRKQN